MRETYAYALLEKKAKKLRKETGNTKLRSILDNGTTTKEVFRLAITRPTKMLLFAPIVSLLSFYMALVYGYLYLLFTAMPALFEGEYHFSSGSVGLSYIGLGVGSLTGLVISGASIDRFAQYLTSKNGGEPKPEYRLPFMGGACFIVPAGLFMFGWSAEHKDHWIVPIIGTSFLGCGMIIVFVSALPLYAAARFQLTDSSSDVHLSLPGRCIRSVCCICHCCKHCTSFAGWSIIASCRTKYVQEPRLWMGNLIARLHCSCSNPIAVYLLQVRRKDSKKELV